MTPKTAQLTDRERVLTNILMFGPLDHWRVAADTTDPVWVPRPNPGDLVRCRTQRTASEWTLAYLVQSEAEHGPHLLRAIGESRMVWMHNESVYGLRNVPDYLLLDRHQWRGYLKLYSALAVVIRKRDYDAPRFSELIYADRETADAVAVLRPHGFLTRNVDGDSNVRLPLSGLHRMTRKSLVQRINDATPGRWWEAIEAEAGEGA